MTLSWRPRLRTVLIAVNVVVLAMPLAALGIFRVYDTELVRRTEAELVSQTAFTAVLYRDALESQPGLKAESLGKPGRARWPVDPESGLHPIPADMRLTLDEIRGPAADPRPSSRPAKPEEIAAGAEVSRLLRQAQRMTLAGIRIVNADGVVVGSTRGEFGMSMAHREEVKRALDGEFVSFARERVSDSPVPQLDSISRRTKIRVFLAIPVVSQGHVVGAVVASRTPISLQKAAYDNRAIFSFLFMGLLLGVFVISLLTSVTIARPIRALRDRAQALADPDEALEVPKETGTQEVAELSRTILETTRALRDRESYLQTFARDVRHEFKAPLSSLRGAVELLQEHIDSMDAERRNRFLDNMSTDVDRLEGLTQDLLELARADVARATEETSNLVEVIERADDHGIELEVDIDRSFDVRVPHDDLMSISSNLFGNVALHGGGAAHLTARRDGDSVRIELEDVGPGFDEEVLGSATQAFVTTARSRGGTGLGLSIVCGYVEAHGGRMEVANRDGALVTIWLPAG